MLNVRIVKGGCRGREAVRFGVVSLKCFPQKSHLVQILHLWSRNLPFDVKLYAKPVVSGGKNPSKTVPATSVVCLFSCLHCKSLCLIFGNFFRVNHSHI